MKCYNYTSHLCDCRSINTKALTCQGHTDTKTPIPSSSENLSSGRDMSSMP